MHLNRITVHVLEHFGEPPGANVVPAGTTIFKAGDDPDFVYILMEGQANILVGTAIVEVARRGTLLGRDSPDRQQAAQRHRGRAHGLQSDADRRSAVRLAAARDARIQPLRHDRHGRSHAPHERQPARGADYRWR